MAARSASLRMAAVTQRTRSRWAWLIPLITLAAVLAPLLWTDRTFVRDWADHLWIAWIQQLKLQHLGHPSWFLNIQPGAYFAWYAFYGGTLYVLTAALGVLFGSALAAFLFMYVLAFAAAFAGWSWLARQLGVSGWRIHVPGFIFVTSAYYLTLAYGRGAFPETVAVSMLPLVAAATLHILRAERTTLGPALTLIIAVALFTGSHALTLVWGTTFLIAGAAIAAVAVGRDRLPPLRRVLATAGVLAIGVGINLWFLVPLVLYHQRTLIANVWSLFIAQTQFTRPGQLFSVMRDSPQQPGLGADIQAQLPVLALGWALAVVVALRRYAGRPWRVVLAGLAVIIAACVAIAVHPSAIRHLPFFWRPLEQPYRLVTFATLAICGISTVALALVERARSRVRFATTALLALIMLVTAAQAIDQVWSVPSALPHRAQIFTSASRPPPTWYDPDDYNDWAARVVTPSLPGRLILPPQVGDDYRRRVVAARGGTIATNVMAGPYLVRVAGAAPVGRTPDGFEVLRIPRGVHELSFAPASSAPLRLGIVGSLVALVAGVLGLAWAGARGLRRRRLLAA